MKQYMAIDQHGHTEHGLGQFPRKELIKRTGFQYVQKMYVDNQAGEPMHVGYIVGPHWFTLYQVIPFHGRGV